MSGTVNKPEEMNRIAKEIYNCRECDLFDDPRAEGLLRPVFPAVTTNKDTAKYTAMVVGLNPGLDEKYMKRRMNLYNKYSDFRELNKYLWEVDVQYNSKDIRKYQRDVTAVYNRVCISSDSPEQAVKPQDIYEHVFWANLSFCASQNPYKRVIGKRVLPCRVLTEEIFNCLRMRFLNRLISVIAPKYIFFFTGQRLYYKVILRMIFGPENFVIMENLFKKQLPVYRSRKGRTVMTEFIAAPIRVDGVGNIKVMFLPHPNYPQKKEYRDRGLNMIRKYFKSKA